MSDESSISAQVSSEGRETSVIIGADGQQVQMGEQVSDDAQAFLDGISRIFEEGDQHGEG